MENQNVMTELKTQIKEFLLAKGLIEQPTSIGICYIYRYSGGDWDKTYHAEVKFPNYFPNRVEMSISCSGNNSESGFMNHVTPKNFKEFLKTLESVRFNSQIEKVKNQYRFSQPNIT